MEAIINKKARFNYTLEETIEAGIQLQGWEVKPILNRKVNLDVSHIYIRDGEIFLMNAQINPDSTTSSWNKAENTRTRKLLLKKKEIMQLIGKVEQKGYTLVPTKIYRTNNKIKVEIALAKGKKAHDKRETIKERDWEREQGKLLKSKLQ